MKKHNKQSPALRRVQAYKTKGWKQMARRRALEVAIKEYDAQSIKQIPRYAFRKIEHLEFKSGHLIKMGSIMKTKRDKRYKGGKRKKR